MIFDDSRYQLSSYAVDSDQTTYFGWRQHIDYVDVDDVIPHIVQTGDTLHSLAAQYLSDSGDTHLWWLIADFQPDPITDPTIELKAGDIILIPPRNILSNELSGLAQDTTNRL